MLIAPGSLNEKALRLIAIVVIGALTPALSGALRAADYWLEALGLIWEEGDDLYEAVCDEDTQPLKAEEADRFQLLTLPGFHPADADRVLNRSHSSPSPNAPFPDEPRAHLLRLLPSELEICSRSVTGRKYGSQTNADVARYGGDPLNYTERFTARSRECQFGATVDRDAGEPRWDDLTRFYARWERGRWAVTAGDFHATVGAGLAVWTQPSLRSRLDVSHAFRPAREDIRLAGDAVENAALRGLAAQGGAGGFAFAAFGARTMLDAALTEDGQLDHLVTTGLHRTANEIRQSSAARETLGGIVLRGYIVNDSDRQMEAHLCSVASEYAPVFDAAPADRDRFPLLGRRFLNGSAGFGYCDRTAALYSEVGFDRDGRSSWMISGSRSFPGERPVDVDAMLFNFPVGVQNPRMSELPEGYIDTGCRGGAVLLSGRRLADWLLEWKSHLEIEYLPWRGYTLPEPSARSRYSLEFRSMLSEGLALDTRYRRRSSVTGHGEEAATEPYDDEKLRLKLNLDDRAVWLPRASGWVEGTCYRAEGEAVDYGVTAGASETLAWRLPPSGGWTLETTFTVVWFSTEGSARLYLGEAALPGRLRSVSLSGQGWRWSAVTMFRQGALLQAGLQVAQTYKPKAPGDVEVWLSVTYKWRKENEE